MSEKSGHFKGRVAPEMFRQGILPPQAGSKQIGAVGTVTKSWENLTFTRR